MRYTFVRDKLLLKVDKASPIYLWIDPRRRFQSLLSPQLTSIFYYQVRHQQYESGDYL